MVSIKEPQLVADTSQLNWMNTYNQEQLQTLQLVRKYLDGLTPRAFSELKSTLKEYLSFRNDLDTFLTRHFNDICTEQCFRSRLSACCSRKGIIAFFADVLVNAVMSDSEPLDRIEAVLSQPNPGFKCIFLGDEGCLWQVTPIVCAIFLCDSAKERVFEGNEELHKCWEALEEQKKRFTWPDRPVLFDDLEALFIDAGLRSPLMYLHDSPGLLRIKQLAGIDTTKR